MSLRTRGEHAASYFKIFSSCWSCHTFIVPEPKPWYFYRPSFHLFYGDHNGGLEAGLFTLFLWDLFPRHCGHYAFHTLSCLVHVSVLKYVNTVGWRVFYSQSQHIYINNRMVGILSTVGQFFSIELHQIEWFNFSFRDKEKWNRKLRRRWGTYYRNAI